MPSSLLSLLLASLLLVSQSDASVQSLVNAVDDMENITNTILNPEAWKSQEQVLSRFASQRPSADKTAVGEAMDRKIAALTAGVAAMQNNLDELIVDIKVVNRTKILVEENLRRLMEATTAIYEKIPKANADENEGLLHPTDWCPWPWKRVRTDLCISYSHEVATWTQAKSHCLWFNGTLVTFKNREDYKAVTRGTVLSYYCPWIGIRWEGNANKFYGPKENNFVNNLGEGSTTNACALACPQGMYYNPCTRKKIFVCMKKRP